MSDIINTLAGLAEEHPVAQARHLRPAAQANAEKSFNALLEPADDSSFSMAERYAVATYVAGLHQDARAREFYADLLGDEDPELLEQLPSDTSTGPYGTFREPGLAAFSEPGGSVLHDGPTPRLAAALDIAHLMVFHPRDSRPEAMGRLLSAGWDEDGIVSLTQLISFLAFQLRVVHGLRELADQPTPPAAATRAEGTHPDWKLTERVSTYPDLARPVSFVAHPLRWQPWIEPVDKQDMTPEQIDSLIKPERIDNAYFRLLARDPDALRARTNTDLDIFYNTDGGLGRVEREISATVVSRYNGCVYCASVHQGRAKEEGGDAEYVDKLLDEGVRADLGSQRWNEIRDIAVSLTSTPVGELNFGSLDLAESIDALYSAAFFNWANRLMLALGEPELPKRFRP